MSPMLRRLTCCLLVSISFCSLASLLASASHHPQGSARVSGLVVDSGDNGIPNVTVKVSKDCKCKDCRHKCDCCPDQMSVNTSSSGSFAVNVPPGTYSLYVDSDKGYGSITVTVQGGEDANVKIVISSSSPETS